MLITSNHWHLTNINNKTENSTQLKYDYNNSSDIPQEFEPIWISLSLISIIIFTVGGNSLVCIAVIRERHLRNTTNYFLTSLAFTDCLVACLVMPLAVTVELIGHFPFDALTCNVWLTFDVCCCTSSIWHMSVMSLDRYLTLRYPLKYGRNKRRSLMAYKIITIWLISFAICLPLFVLGLINSSNVYNEKTRACFPAHQTFKIYGSFVAFFIPLIIMIVTYALTMSALQQAHSTKQQRSQRRKNIHAVINLAAMAIRWKRAVSTVEIPDEKKSSIIPQQEEIPSSDKKITVDHQRKRASSLLGNEHPKKPISTSTQCLNELSKPSSSIYWNNNTKDKQSRPSTEKFIEHSSHQHLDPRSLNNLQIHTKRSRSCAPLLDVEISRKDQRRSSSVHTLLQIRRDSAKISEELANLTAQLSASMNNNGSTSKRPSLSVPGASGLDENHTPTIDQLLAETNLHQPIVIPTTFLNITPKRRERSRSADIRLPTFKLNNDQASINTQPIPNLLITYDSIQNLRTHNLEQVTHRVPFDKKCQRIKDWITVTTSSTVINNQHHSRIPTRCSSAINVTENTPMLLTNKQSFPPLTNLKRHFPRIEQLYGQTSAPNSSLRPRQQTLLMDDHISSVQNFAVLQRSSVCSITSSMLIAHFRNTRPSTTSSVGSASQQGTVRKRPPRLKDGMSQASFQMVSLDTDESSSGTSSLTQQSAILQSAIAGTSSPIVHTSHKKRQKFYQLTNSSANNERKAMRVLLIIFSIFIILWTPFFIINLLSCFVPDIHPIIMSVATWLGYCSSGANPIVYTIFSRAFRQAFLNILTCRKVIRSHRASHVFRQSCHSMTQPTSRKLSSLSKGQIDIQ